MEGSFVSSAVIAVDGKLLQADVETRHVRNNLNAARLVFRAIIKEGPIVEQPPAGAFCLMESGTFLT
jgi:hypothetical protein